MPDTTINPENLASQVKKSGRVVYQNGIFVDEKMQECQFLIQRYYLVIWYLK